MSELTLGAEDRVVASVGPRWWDGMLRRLKQHERLVLVCTAAFQAGLVLTIIAVQAVPYLVGETILLKVMPVDPRDMFRGDYVTLDYAINRWPPAAIDGIPSATRRWRADWRDEQWLEDRTVYVTLQPDADGRHWHGVSASTKRPDSGKYIRGKYSHGAYSQGAWAAPLRFGIEAYYVQEGTGREYEKAVRDRKLAAEIVLTSWGQAKLKALKIE